MGVVMAPDASALTTQMALILAGRSFRAARAPSPVLRGARRGSRQRPVFRGEEAFRRSGASAAYVLHSGRSDVMVRDRTVELGVVDADGVARGDDLLRGLVHEDADGNGAALLRLGGDLGGDVERDAALGLGPEDHTDEGRPGADREIAVAGGRHAAHLDERRAGGRRRRAGRGRAAARCARGAAADGTGGREAGAEGGGERGHGDAARLGVITNQRT